MRKERTGHFSGIHSPEAGSDAESVVKIPRADGNVDIKQIAYLHISPGAFGDALKSREENIWKS